jgi:hypothetical protein
MSELQKINLIDFAKKLDLDPRALEGAWLPFVDPSGAPIGLAVLVLSSETAPYRKHYKRFVARVGGKSETWRKLNAEAEAANHICKYLVKDIWIYDVDAEPNWLTDIKPDFIGLTANPQPRYAPKELEDLMNSALEVGVNTLAKQVDDFAATTENFDHIEEPVNLGKSSNIRPKSTK